MVDLRLASTVEAVAEARRAVDVLAADLPVRRRDDLQLLVSELVTNAVRHAGLGPGDSIRVTAGVHDSVMRIEVRDPGSGFTAREEPVPDADRASGWGLFLVAELADRWGVEDARPGTCVWFEMDADGAAIASTGS